MSAIWLMVRELLTSKKFVVFVSGLIVTLLAKYKFDVDPATVQNIIYMIVAYLIGQGVADAGKEAAKVSGTVEIATTQLSGSDPPREVKDKLI